MSDEPILAKCRLCKTEQPCRLHPMTNHESWAVCDACFELILIDDYRTMILLVAKRLADLDR
jgi:hypothetical protein